MGLGHRMARLMPLLLAAASAKELQGVKHVLAGSEYSGSAASQRDERALVFGDDVPADKFRSCKKHGSDPRSLNDFTTEDIEKMKNVSFSDPEYTNKVRPSRSPQVCFRHSRQLPGVACGQPRLFLRLHPAVLRSECTY